MQSTARQLDSSTDLDRPRQTSTSTNSTGPRQELDRNSTGHRLDRQGLDSASTAPRRSLESSTARQPGLKTPQPRNGAQTTEIDAPAASPGHRHPGHRRERRPPGPGDRVSRCFCLTHMANGWTGCASYFRGRAVVSSFMCASFSTAEPQSSSARIIMTSGLRLAYPMYPALSPKMHDLQVISARAIRPHHLLTAGSHSPARTSSWARHKKRHWTSIRGRARPKRQVGGTPGCGCGYHFRPRRRRRPRQ